MTRAAPGKLEDRWRARPDSDGLGERHRHPVNDPPTASDDATTTSEDTATPIDGLANDDERDDDTLTVTGHSQPVDLLGDVTVNPVDHNPMWVAMSQDRPTRIMFDVP